MRLNNYEGNDWSDGNGELSLQDCRNHQLINVCDMLPESEEETVNSFMLPRSESKLKGILS
jgi:hypothetical protein